LTRLSGISYKVWSLGGVVEKYATVKVLAVKNGFVYFMLKALNQAKILTILSIYIFALTIHITLPFAKLTIVTRLMMLNLKHWGYK